MLLLVILTNLLYLRQVSFHHPYGKTLQEIWSETSGEGRVPTPLARLIIGDIGPVGQLLRGSQQDHQHILSHQGIRLPPHEADEAGTYRGKPPAKMPRRYPARDN